jgi:coproporphyrinogen III oxidase-like Fe-S oxidoreductase
MKCTEINTWINNASDQDMFQPNETIVQHLVKCASCNAKLKAVQLSFQFMNSQKKESLSDELTNQIIKNLLVKESSNSNLKLTGRIFINRIAAILIIAFGLLAGIIAGSMLINNVNSEDNVWSAEFTLLSNNTENYLFE